MPTPPRPRRRLVLVGIVTATTLSLGGSAVVQFQADHSWQSMQVTRDELQAEWNAMPQQRSVAWGEPIAGDAFTHYRRATELARERGATDYLTMVPMLQESDAEVASGHAELHQRWQPVLAALRAGARSAEAMPTAGRGSNTNAIENLLDCRWVANAAVFAARAARHAGRHAEAVQHSLDATMFGADLMRRGQLINQMIGSAILAIGSAEAWPEPALMRLDGKALDLLASGLERIDRSLPTALDLTGELLWLADTLQGAAPADTFGPASATWRYGFSTRWMFADAFTRLTTAMREIESATELAWPQRQALFELQTAALVGTGNPVLQTLVPNLGGAETNYRQSLAMLRLLRMAIDVHRGLDVPPLRDPLGLGPIRVQRNGGSVRFACEGAEQRASLSRTVVR